MEKGHVYEKENEMRWMLELGLWYELDFHSRNLVFASFGRSFCCRAFYMSCTRVFALFTAYGNCPLICQSWLSFILFHLLLDGPKVYLRFSHIHQRLRLLSFSENSAVLGICLSFPFNLALQSCVYLVEKVIPLFRYISRDDPDS